MDNELRPILFSVVIPTYNHANFLKIALQSVIDQDYESWEAIVVDNNSSDNTKEVIDSFEDSRIRVVSINNNGIIAASRNIGIKESSGDWIAFLDSDDKWYPSKLYDVNETIKCMPYYDVISSDEIKVNEHKQKIKTLRFGPLPKKSYKHMLLYGNKLSTSATVVKKSFIINQKITFNEHKNYITVEDYDFWLHVALNGAKFKFIPKINGEYLIHKTNNSLKEDIHYQNGLFLLNDHVFNIQSFTLSKEKLFRKVKTRLNIHKSFLKFEKNNPIPFFKAIVPIFIENPLNSITYILARGFLYIYNKFPFLR